MNASAHGQPESDDTIAVSGCDHPRSTARLTQDRPHGTHAFGQAELSRGLQTLIETMLLMFAKDVENAPWVGFIRRVCIEDQRAGLDLFGAETPTHAQPDLVERGSEEKCQNQTTSSQRELGGLPY